MPPPVTIKVEGLSELGNSLKELPAAASRGVLRRVGVKALAPFLEAVKRLAPVDDPGDTPERPPSTYRDSWRIGTRLNQKQARAVKKLGKSEVEVYAGTNDRVGGLIEFGTRVRTQRSTGREVGAVTAKPHARPAWDATQDEVLSGVVDGLKPEIDKAAERAARKAARLARR